MNKGERITDLCRQRGKAITEMQTLVSNAVNEGRGLRVTEMQRFDELDQQAETWKGEMDRLESELAADLAAGRVTTANGWPW
jgi:hypothetical protein